MALYLYALVEGRPRTALRSRTGIARERLAVASMGRIAAVTGTIDEVPAPSESALRKHAAIVRDASRVWTAVLPVRFGTSVSDLRALRQTIARRRATLLGALAQVRGRVQMTVRVLGAAPVAPEAARKSIDRAKGPGTRYLKRAAAVESWIRRLPELDSVRRAVHAFVRAERVDVRLTPPLVATVFHLVDRADVGRYRHAMLGVSAAPFRLAVTGPFPPYAFGPDDL